VAVKEVEANQGISSSKPHARRRADSTRSGGLRNLHWGQHPTDIALLPQSPLTIQDALTTPNARIHLVANDHRIPVSTNEFHLKTKYNAKRLREQCRQLVIESALAKSKHEKSLYIACGFVNWQLPPTDDNENEAQTCSAPLLFYPVRLITEEGETAEGIEHLLFNADAVAHENLHLQDEFARHFQIELPNFNPKQSLHYFFDQIEQATKSLTNCSVDIRMRLGIASAPAGVNPENQTGAPKLEKIPKRFRFTLAKRLIENLALDDLQTTLKLLAASNDFKFSRARGSTSTAPDIARVREFAMLLAQYGLGHVEFHLLPDLPGSINKWIAETEPALESPLLRECFAEHDISAIQLVKLAGIIELIDKAPDNIHTQFHPDLAYRGTHLLFKRAKHQAKLIHDELAQLQHHFHLDRIPAKAQLLQLIEELGGQHDQGIDVVDSDYFNARRQFMDFSTEKPTTLSADHKRMLAKLVKVLRFRELFVNNSEYRLAFGSAYRGLKTDWDKLEQVLDYAQELRQVLDSAALAATAIGDWRSFRENYTRSMASLLSADKGIRSLLKIIRSSDQTTGATALLIKGKFLGDQLRSWNVDYGFIENYANESANSLLHLFSGNAGIDARTEDLVRDANNRIQHFLIDNHENIGSEQISDTLSWLNHAVNTESVTLFLNTKSPPHLEPKCLAWASLQATAFQTTLTGNLCSRTRLIQYYNCASPIAGVASEASQWVSYLCMLGFSEPSLQSRDTQVKSFLFGFYAHTPKHYLPKNHTLGHSKERGKNASPTIVQSTSFAFCNFLP